MTHDARNDIGAHIYPPIVSNAIDDHENQAKDTLTASETAQFVKNTDPHAEAKYLKKMEEIEDRRSNRTMREEFAKRIYTVARWWLLGNICNPAIGGLQGPFCLSPLTVANIIPTVM